MEFERRRVEEDGERERDRAREEREESESEASDMAELEVRGVLRLVAERVMGAK